MSRIAYRLISNKTIKNVEDSFLYDIDEDFTTKKGYIKKAIEYTKSFNEDFKTNYTYKDLFGTPEDIGYRYCSKCDCFFWNDEDCCCED